MIRVVLVRYAPSRNKWPTLLLISDVLYFNWYFFFHKSKYLQDMDLFSNPSLILPQTSWMGSLSCFIWCSTQHCLWPRNFISHWKKRVYGFAHGVHCSYYVSHHPGTASFKEYRLACGRFIAPNERNSVSALLPQRM